MEIARLMNTPEDYKALGIKDGPVEVWEDGRRNDGKSGNYEWWYIDAMMEDGTKLCFTYADKTVFKFQEDEPFPYVKVVITTPDGEEVTERIEYTAADAAFGKDKCDVIIGPHSFIGDLKEYKLHFEPVNGIGAELSLTSLGKPWRPGTAYFAFGDDDDYFFTWLCAVPQAEVTGTVTVGGETRQVKGYGYHDHQWGSIHMLFAWNHWIWARQKVGDYNILVFDMTANERFGFTRYNLCFIQDSKGDLVFENNSGAKVEFLDVEYDDLIEKTCPTKVKFTYDNNGKQVEYTIRQLEKLEIRNEYKTAAPEMQVAFDGFGLKPSYSRLEGEGELVIIDGAKRTEEKGKLIYELAYLASQWRED